MSIRRVEIRNYRSLENVDFDFSAVNALIGPNNAGKSNILHALNLILGETWPSRPFGNNDFFAHETNRVIDIKVYFEQPLQCDPEVSGFCLSSQGVDGVEFFPIDDNGHPCQSRWGRVKRVSNEMRKERALLHLGLDRLAEKQLRPTQWTLYGKLLREIEAGIDVQDKSEVVNKINQAVDDHVLGSIIGAQTIIDDFVRQQTGLPVQLSFRTIDPLQVLKNFRPSFTEGAMVVDPEEAGAGIQSALSVGIAKAYAEFVKQPVILAIEEPELYLHPHGCRHFFRLLQDLSQQGLQLLYTTHERSFVSAGEYEAIHIVRKPQSATTVTSGNALHLVANQRERLRLQSKFNDRMNEAFFASAVVLVEGDADEVACRCALEQLGMELDKLSISVLAVGGVGEIPLIGQLLSALGVPVIALVDQDPGNAKTAAVVAAIQNAIGANNVFLQVPGLEGILGLAKKPNRVVSMETFPAWFAANALPPVYADVRNCIVALLA